MARDRQISTGADRPLFTNPGLVLTIGLVLTAAALLWDLISGHAAPALAFLGLLASGLRVNVRPRSFLVLAVAALSGVFAWYGLRWHPSAGGTNWDSARAL